MQSTAGFPSPPIFEALYTPATEAKVVPALEEALSGQGYRILPESERASAPPGRLVTFRIQRSSRGITEVLGLRTGEGEALGEQLSRSLILALHAHIEGELWGYTLFRSGRTVDRFHSLPEALDLDEDEAAAFCGKPDVVASTWPGVDEARVAELLSDASPDASALLSDFLEEIGVPGALEAAPALDARLLHALHPDDDRRPDLALPSPDDEAEMMQAMLGAMGIEGPRADEYMSLMKDAMAMVESAGGGDGASEADLENAARKLSADARFKEISGRLRSMGDEIRGAFDKGMQSDADPRTRAMYERYERASGIEAQMLQNVAGMDRHPREAIKKNAELLREIVEATLHEELPRSIEAARTIDAILESFRHRDRAAARDVQSALPTLAAHFVADCVLSLPGTDLVRLPAEGEIRLRRGAVEANPLDWIRRALSRRNPEPLAPVLDRFLGVPEP